MQFINKNRNLTLILPVDCNAKCSFCFWNKQEKTNFDDWYNNLSKVLSKVDNYNFTSISISGGEPTLNAEYLIKTLKLIRSKLPLNFKVVLNTNGYGLPEVKDNYEFISVIKHINLSRHGATDELNKKVINSDLQLSNEELKEIISDLTNDYDIDVSLNTVYSDDTHTLDDLNSMYELAKQINCSSITFRQDVKYGLAESALMEDFKHINAYSYRSGCEVCKEIKFNKFGFETRFKYGVAEPSEILDDDQYFEFIFNEKGILCTDWAGTKKVDLILKQEALSKKLIEQRDDIDFKIEFKNESRLITSINTPPTRWSIGSTGC